MVITPRRTGSTRVAGSARNPGRGSLRLAAFAIAIAAAIASSPALPQGKGKGKGHSANVGPVVPEVMVGVGNPNKLANVVVPSIPVAINTLVGNSSIPLSNSTANVIILPSATTSVAPGNTLTMNMPTASGAGLGLSKMKIGASGPGPSALQVAAIANGAGLIPAGAAGNGTGVPASNGIANVIILPSATAGVAPANIPTMPTASGAGLGSSNVKTGPSGPSQNALPVTAIANGAGLIPAGAAGNETGVPLISSVNGQLLLAPGQSVEIADPSSPSLRVVITAPGHHSLDIGKIVANAGRLGIYAALAARSGPRRANGVKFTSDSRVLLTSTGNSGTRGHRSKSDDSHEQATGRNLMQASNSPGHRSAKSDLNVKTASVHGMGGMRGDNSKNDDSHGQATGRKLLQDSDPPGRRTEENAQIVNAASVQGSASHTVEQQIDADRDATLKTGDAAINNTGKRESHKSRVCS